MQQLSKLEDREAEYTFRKKSLNPEEFTDLFKVLNRLNGSTVDFRHHYFGKILSHLKRVYSVRKLDSKSWEGRHEKSILLATLPSKDKGFFIPWSPYSRATPEIVQVISQDRVIFENAFLINKYHLRNLKCHSTLEHENLHKL